MQLLSRYNTVNFVSRDISYLIFTLTYATLDLT
ncbi:MAG: hypothetical protein ACJAXH_003619, partial [Colwellia sp.]